VSSLAGIIDKIKAFLNVVVDFLKLASKIVSALTDPIVAAIQAIINELLRLVEGYLEDLGGYLLPVPIRKRLATDFLGIGDFTPTVASNIGIFGAAYSANYTPEINQFLSSVNRYSGGNAGFFRTVVESLNDEGDINRPQFNDPEDYVGGFTFMAGSAGDPLGFLDDLWKLFGLFGFTGGSSDSLPQIPRPQNLRAKAMTSAGGGKFNVMLSWDPVTVPLTKMRDLGDIILVPERYAIIRAKNDATILGATTVPEIMGKRDIKKGDTFSNGNIEVVEERDWDLADVTYVDTDVSADATDSFYYAAAWKLKAYNDRNSVANRLGESLDYWYISNVARVTPYPMLPASAPPDWIRTPSLGSIFPALANVIQKLVLQIAALGTKAMGTGNLLSEYVAFLEREVARYARIANEILDEIARLNSMLQIPSVGVYMRSFSGKGGNSFLISDLAQSLLSGYKGAPPFHRGDEYVAGAVLLAGGPHATVTKFTNALSLLFGSSASDNVKESFSNLAEAVSQVEKKTFGEAFQPVDDVVSDTSFGENFMAIKKCGEVVAEPSTFDDSFGVSK
jgi:hypothetical protein